MTPDTAVFYLLLVGAGTYLYSQLHDKYLFWLLPHRANRLHMQGKDKEAIAFLESLLQRRVFGDKRQQVLARSYLAGAYNNTKQYEKAIEQVNMALHNPDVARVPMYYVGFTTILADSLLALGRDSEAEAAIFRLETALANRKTSAENFEHRAMCFALQHKYAEAAEDLNQCLQMQEAWTIPSPRPRRIVNMAHYYNAAEQSVKALDTARNVIQISTKPEIRVAAFYHASEAAKSLGRLDESKQWYERGIKEAQKLKAKNLLISLEMLLSIIQYSEGDLELSLTTAERTCRLRQERELQSEGHFLDTMQASVSLVRGQYTKAIDILNAIVTAPNLPQSHQYRWALAPIKIKLVWAYLEMGQTEEALYYLHQVYPILRNTTPKRLHCESLGCWAETLLRPNDVETRTHIHELEEHLWVYVRANEDDLTGVRASAETLAIAYCNIGDYTGSLRLLNLYKQSNPLPVYHCRYAYYLGVCYEGLGQTAEAKTAYEECIIAGIDIPRVQKAEAALARLSAHN